MDSFIGEPYFPIFLKMSVKVSFQCSKPELSDKECSWTFFNLLRLPMVLSQGWPGSWSLCLCICLCLCIWLCLCTWRQNVQVTRGFVPKDGLGVEVGTFIFVSVFVFDFVFEHDDKISGCLRCYPQGCPGSWSWHFHRQLSFSLWSDTPLLGLCPPSGFGDDDDDDDDDEVDDFDDLVDDNAKWS